MTPESAFRSASLPRFQVFEFHERDWFPTSFRNAITEVLRALSLEMRVHDVIGPILESLLDRTGADSVIDLCSGAGGPILAIQQRLARSDRYVPVLLTDKYPNVDAFERAEKAGQGLVRGHKEPVDATQVPAELTGVRTLFNAFHHFDPPSARSILADAYRQRQPIAIFEITERSFFNTFSIFGASFIAMLLLMPRMRSRKFEWWLFTYLLPILPAAFGWDGFISCLRSYTAEEFEELTKDLADEHYGWTTGRLPVAGGPMHINYFLGFPEQIK
jgi:hypothetical protein